MVLHVTLVTLATCYVTYVIARSEFPLALAARDRVFRRWGEGSWQSYLVTCTWCTAAYASGAVTLGTALTSKLEVPVLVWPAAAFVTGLLLEIVEMMWHVRSR